MRKLLVIFLFSFGVLFIIKVAPPQQDGLFVLFMIVGFLICFTLAHIYDKQSLKIDRGEDSRPSSRVFQHRMGEGPTMMYDYPPQSESCPYGGPPGAVIRSRDSHTGEWREKCRLAEDSVGSYRLKPDMFLWRKLKEAGCPRPQSGHFWAACKLRRGDWQPL